MAKTKVKVVKAKVVKAKRAKRMSKGNEFPWTLQIVTSDGYHQGAGGWQIRKDVEDYIKTHPKLNAPVIVHIDIPPMEY